MSTNASPRRNRPVFIVLLLVVIALLAPQAASATTTPATGCANADVLPTAANVEQVRSATLCLINAQRSARGLRKLRDQSTLERVATSYAAQMGREQFFDHVSPSGSTVLTRIKATTYLRHVRDWTAGENIAWGTLSLSTPRATVKAWMASPGHRANILSRSYSEIGIGVAAGGATRLVNPSNSGTTYVTNFGSRTR